VVAPLSARSARRRGQGIARRGAEARPLGVAPWLTRGTWFRSLDGLEGTQSLPCLSEVLDVEAWGSLDVELKLGRSMWHMVDQGNAAAPLSTRSARRRGLGIARRGAGTRPLDLAPWSTRGTRSLACLSGVLDVEAWGPLGVELKLGRSTWHVVDQGKTVAPLSARSARRRGLGITRRGAGTRTLGVAPWSTRGTWFRSLDGLEGTRSLPVCPESRRRGLGITRRGAEARPLGVAPWSTRGTQSLPCLSGVSTSRPRDRSAWSWNSAARRGAVVDQRNVVPIARRPGGNAVAPPVYPESRRRGLGIARRGAEARPLDLARGRPGKRSRSPVYPECSTSRPGDHSTGS
jgi:hypothetical protein